MKRIALLTLVSLLAAVSIYAADPWIGTWKWNAGKAQTNSTNPIKSRTDKFEALPDGSIKYTRTETRADGTSRNGGGTFKMDGKEYPITGLQYNTISVKRVSGTSYETVTVQKGGKYKQTTLKVFSADGKTKTSTSSGTDTDGKPVSSAYVYDKQ